MPTLTDLLRGEPCAHLAMGWVLQTFLGSPPYTQGSLHTTPCFLPALSEHGITLHPSLLSSQFNPTYESEKPDLNHLTVGNQDGPGLEKRVGSAISVISNAVEGMSHWILSLVTVAPKFPSPHKG